MIIIFAIAIAGAYLAGYATCWSTDRSYWRLFKFCPCCSRLDCQREHDPIVRPGDPS